MGKVEYILRKEVVELKKIVNQARKRLETAPQGFLRIKKKREGVEYYYKNPHLGTGNGKYLKKSEIKLVREIAQRAYDEQTVKKAEERIRAIDKFLEKYEETDLGELYRKLSPCRSELIDAAVISDEEYVRRWQEEKYSGKSFAEDAPEIITERGEQVRTKSEKIIADKLYALGVPYRYECPLILDGNIKVYPDFTILKMPEKEEVYLEHLGMMDDNGYVNGMLYKLKTYEKNGIYLGVHLFITYETGREPLNTRALDGLVRKLFCENR